MQSSTTEPREIHNAGWVCANNHGPYATRQEAESCQYCKPDIDRLAETIEDEAATLYGNGDVRFDGRDALASLKAALDELVALAREGLRIQADEHEAIPGPKWWREHTEAAEARVAELEAALRDTLTEIDELGTAYTALRKKHEPPYIVYIPWSRPAALAALAGDDGGGA